MKLLKTRQSEEATLFCECHRTEPVKKLYLIRDVTGADINVCSKTFEELKGLPSICKYEECLNEARSTYCIDCALAGNVSWTDV